MKRIILFLLILSAVGFLYWNLRNRENYEEAVTITNRRLRYSFTITNTTAHALPGANFQIFAPSDNTPVQTIRELSASENYSLQFSAARNGSLLFESFFPPFGSRTVSVTAIAELRSLPQKSAPPEGHEYLSAEKFVEADSSEIEALAKSLRSEDPMSTARNIYQWIESNLKSRSFTREYKGARYALKLKEGDCTEFALLFTALSRAAGIPARALAGFYMETDAVLRPAAYHNWAEFYANGRWQLADAFRGNFATAYSNYLQIGILNELEPFSQFRSSFRELKATMN